MGDQSVEARAQSVLEDIQKHRSPQLPPWVLPVALLAALLLCIGLSIFRSYPGKPKAAMSATLPLNAPILLPLPTTTTDPTQFLMVQPGLDERDDLFYCAAVLTYTCANLTQSPAIAEVWPVPDTAAEGRVAYYGVSDAGTELFILTLPTSATLPLTVRASASGLHIDFEITPTLAPVFSPDGRWVAFPAQAVEGGAVELFVAQTDGQQVQRVTKLGYYVRDYIWLDDRTLVVAVQWPDSTLHYWTAQLESGGFRLEPMQ